MDVMKWITANAMTRIKCMWALIMNSADAAIVNIGARMGAWKGGDEEGVELSAGKDAAVGLGLFEKIRLRCCVGALSEEQHMALVIPHVYM